MSDGSGFEPILKKINPQEKNSKKRKVQVEKAFQSSDDESFNNDVEVLSKKNQNKSNKRLSVERIYQKKTQLEHILLRPDTYIGSVEFLTQQMWVYDGELDQMVLREITYVPGLYKIFDEILVNAADNKQRDKKMDTIKIDIEPENNKISVYNNGKGIPIIMHKVEKVYVPSLIFGHLLTSSNYNDDEKKVTGGRNGYGAKLCNIFSIKFIVETHSKENKLSFSQTWENNMSKTNEPKIVSSSGENFTRITFYPDLSKFKMEKLDSDIVSLISRRAYDIAGSTSGIKVYLNGTHLKIKNFKDYMDLYINKTVDDNDHSTIIYEKVNDRWEIGLSISDKGFQQVSFVNSIATTKGGRHVDYVLDQVLTRISEAVKKKNKQGVNVKTFQLKNHIWLFVNCLIENPTFDSQTKENMTLQAKSFGSVCHPSEKFFNQILKIGILESILTWVNYKAQAELAKSCASKKTSKLKNLPKLDDANDAGTKNSNDCTLILTEGDSAKSLVIAGLGVIGRDKYGCFPLRGKMLNVREATHKQILENIEINNIIKIMGLQYNKKYLSLEDLKSLRYGRLMIMTDQDQDGSHIKGLLINFIHHNWPSLLKIPFLEQFITPIVKVSKNKEVHSFYSIPEFEEWKTNTSNWKSWNIKYYKGLGTSTSDEAKEYFSNLHRNRIKFKYEDTKDDDSILLAFSKKMVDNRKEWLTQSMEERKSRRELGLPEIYLYEKGTKEITYKDFVNKELVLFSNADNERSIPSIMDGLKPGQRKVLFTCFKRKDKKEVKVAQLAGAVGEKSAYHHGEASLQSTIIGLAQNFVGSNNISLLLPNGQFGTRLQGGKDSASPRYIFTMLSPLTRKLFPISDDPLLNYLYDDNLRIEPEYYVPILPMVLVNGSTGIGTGWSTNIPNYNPRDLVENLRRLIKGEEPLEMIPWFKNFRGKIVKMDDQRFMTIGELSILEENKLEITELPIRTWTQTYKENILEIYSNSTDKIPASILDYKEYHTDATVRFVISLTNDQMNKVRENGFYKFFKLQTSLSTSSMVLFDHNGVLRKYETTLDILKEFYLVRKDFYYKRKAYLEGLLDAESSKLSNQARFIMENIENDFFLVKLKEELLVRELIKHNYDEDPLKKWRKENKFEDEDVENGDESMQHGFAYLLNMNIRTLLPDHAAKLLKKKEDKLEELSELRKTKPETFWIRDLDAFIEELDKFEKNELEAIEKKHSQVKAKNKGKLPLGKKNKNNDNEETKPSPFGEKIKPDEEIENLKKQNENKGKRIKKIKDENVILDKNEDTDKLLISNNQDIEMIQVEDDSSEQVKSKEFGKTKKTEVTKKIKQTAVKKTSGKINSKTAKSKVIDEIENLLDSFDEKEELTKKSAKLNKEMKVTKKEKPQRKSNKKTVKYNFDTDSEEDVEEIKLSTTDEEF